MLKIDDQRKNNIFVITLLFLQDSFEHSLISNIYSSLIIIFFHKITESSSAPIIFFLFYRQFLVVHFLGGPFLEKEPFHSAIYFFIYLK